MNTRNPLLDLDEKKVVDTLLKYKIIKEEGEYVAMTEEYINMLLEKTKRKKDLYATGKINSITEALNEAVFESIGEFTKLNPLSGDSLILFIGVLAYIDMKGETFI